MSMYAVYVSKVSKLPVRSANVHILILESRTVGLGRRNVDVACKRQPFPSIDSSSSSLEPDSSDALSGK